MAVHMPPRPKLYSPLPAQVNREMCRSVSRNKPQLSRTSSPPHSIMKCVINRTSKYSTYRVNVVARRWSEHLRSKGSHLGSDFNPGDREGHLLP